MSEEDKKKKLEINSLNENDSLNKIESKENINLKNSKILFLLKYNLKSILNN